MYITCKYSPLTSRYQVNCGGGFPCAEHVRCTSESRSAEMAICERCISFGGIVLLGSVRWQIQYHMRERERDIEKPLVRRVQYKVAQRQCVVQ